MENYYKHLGRVQNHPVNIVVDIMTITAFMNKEEQIKHLKYYAQLVGDVMAIEYCKQ